MNAKLFHLAKQRISAVFASNTVVNITFASGERLVITPRGDGSSQLDVQAYDDRGVAAVMIDRELAGYLQVDLASPSDMAGDDAAFPRSDWQYEVANGDTRLGYAEWLEHRREDRAAGAQAEGQ